MTTPNAWKIVEVGIDFWTDTDRLDIQDASGIVICSNVQPEYAALIAAAPDLLEALKMAAASLRWYKKNHPESWHAGDEQEAEETRALIARLEER